MKKMMWVEVEDEPVTIYKTEGFQLTVIQAERMSGDKHYIINNQPRLMYQTEATFIGTNRDEAIAFLEARRHKHLIRLQSGIDALRGLQLASYLAYKVQIDLEDKTIIETHEVESHTPKAIKTKTRRQMVDSEKVKGVGNKRDVAVYLQRYRHTIPPPDYNKKTGTQVATWIFTGADTQDYDDVYNWYVCRKIWLESLKFGEQT